MAGFLERLGATDTPRQLSLLVLLVSGELAALSFLFPDTLGATLPARVLIVTAVACVGSALVYLALLPAPDDTAPA